MKNPILSLLSITLLLFLVNISFAQNSNITKSCVDNDGDGYEDTSCGGTDCDDSDPNIHPGAEEIPGNGIDENCDGSDACTCYVDADNDDYGDSNSPIMSLDCDCDDSGEAWVGYDCDDADPNVHPGATEVVDDGIDNDCSGDCLCWADADDDGYRPDAVSTVISSDLDCHDSGEATTADITGDCDDFDPSVHPGATEIINDGIDQDCNGFDAIYCYQDNDFDTYGNNIDPQIIANDGDCDDMGESNNDLDCDDADQNVNPGEPEIWYDAIDQNCDGLNDFDKDFDGYVDSNFPGEEGGSAPFGGDCDDSNPDIHPGATEIVDDGIDQDCNGYDAVHCYVDDDFDNYGDGSVAQIISYDGDCDDLGESENDLDCDDNNPSVNPGEAEIVNDGIDQDCNGFDAVYCYVDDDFDNYGDGAAPQIISYDGDCDDLGESENDLDCDDNLPDVNPDAAEIWYDGIDQNCDNLNDFDQDFDGYVDENFPGEEGGSAPMGGDCDDSNPDVNPAEVEIAADGIDNDCDGTCLCFLDADDDGFRPDGTATVESADCDCDDFGEATATDPIGDCDDSNPDINPDATEICDGIDNNCIDGIDEDFYANMYYDNATVCYNNENYIPTIEGVLGGTFTSSPDGLIIDIITGEINVENSDLGDYIIAYQTESPCDIQSNFNLSIVTTNISVTENHPNLTANNDIANYQWIDCSDMSIIEGETNQLFTALEDGSYAVIITEDVCVDTSQCYEIIGLGYNSFKNKIKIYPNPTNGEITISLAKEQDVKIIVTNITGQTVKLDSYKNTKLLNVNIVGTSGIYFVEIISNTETVVFKLIKQ